MNVGGRGFSLGIFVRSDWMFTFGNIGRQDIVYVILWLFQLVPTEMAIGIDFPNVGFAIDGALIVFIWRWRLPLFWTAVLFSKNSFVALDLLVFLISMMRACLL